jgi:tetratricopeptide (TPR) repeat protein
LKTASPAELNQEFQRLAAALNSRLEPNDRTRVRGEIITLFRRTETALTELTEFRDSIRELVDRFKALPEAEVPPPTQSVRHDHIGASTAIERGWSSLASGDWHQAEVDLRVAIQRDPGNITGTALLGWALMHQDRGDEALQLCLQVLLREPEQGLARTAVGVICLKKGITGEAIEHLQRATRTSKDARAALYANYWLGVAYLERDMPGDALEFLRRAVSLGPNLAEGWAELGRAMWFRGQTNEALQAWTTGAALRHSPHASRCASLLETVAVGGVPPRALHS